MCCKSPKRLQAIGCSIYSIFTVFFIIYGCHKSKTLENQYEAKRRYFNIHSSVSVIIVFSRVMFFINLGTISGIGDFFLILRLLVAEIFIYLLFCLCVCVSVSVCTPPIQRVGAHQVSVCATWEENNKCQGRSVAGRRREREMKRKHEMKSRGEYT